MATLELLAGLVSGLAKMPTMTIGNVKKNGNQQNPVLLPLNPKSREVRAPRGQALKFIVPRIHTKRK
jgi:hypothetical protein